MSPSGTGKTLRSSSRLRDCGQDLDRGSVPLTDRSVVQRLQHGRRVPSGCDRTGCFGAVRAPDGRSGGRGDVRPGSG